MTNDFKPFGNGPGDDATDQATYAAALWRTQGWRSGILPHQQINKVLRQATQISAAVAQVATEITGGNALDDGNYSAILDLLREAFSAKQAYNPALTYNSGSIGKFLQTVTETNELTYAATRGEIKSIPTSSAVKFCVLGEPGREGLFFWVLGNFSARVAADAFEGVTIKANDAPATTGAWIRAVADGDYWYERWFDVPRLNPAGTSGPTGHVAYSSIINTANIVKPRGIRFGSGIIGMDAHPAALTYICELEGAGGGEQPTIFVRRYGPIIPAPARQPGLFEYTQWAPRIKNINVQAFGDGIGQLAYTWMCGSTPPAGEALLENFRCSMGVLYANEMINDGSLNNTPATAVGLRTGTMRGIKCFGNLVMRSCQHWMGPEMFIAGDLVVTGTAAAPSDDNHLVGVVGRNLDLGAGSDSTGYVKRFSLSGNVTGSVLNRATNDFCTVLADGMTGITESNWPANCTLLPKKLIKRSGSTSGPGVTGFYVEYGDGTYDQWGSVVTASGDATVVFPITHPNSTEHFTAGGITAPAAGQIQEVQAHSPTLSGGSIRSVVRDLSGSGALSSTIVNWRAKGR